LAGRSAHAVGVPTADRSRRRRAAALAGHGGDEPAARSALADDDAEVRATALGALVRMGRAGPDDVAHAADDAAPAVRCRAAEVLATGVARAAAVDLLVRLLGDEDASVVEVSAWACGELDPSEPSLVVPLAALAGGHDDALVREAAVAALGAIGDQSGLPAILAATTDKPAVRRRAVLALAPFEGPEVEAALDRALADRDVQVRQAAEDLRA
jgi:HEAT repeat protein